MSPAGPACLFPGITPPLWAWAWVWEAEKWVGTGCLALLQSPVLGSVSSLGVL